MSLSRDRRASANQETAEMSTGTLMLELDWRRLGPPMWELKGHRLGCWEGLALGCWELHAGVSWIHIFWSVHTVMFGKIARTKMQDTQEAGRVKNKKQAFTNKPKTIESKIKVVQK